MSKMISVSSGFQYSVNIGFDLNNDEKLKNFIPTKSSLALLKDILLSTRHSSTERARVLIGAYGKGKSHIVLTILAMLYKRDKRLFEKLLPKAAEDHQLMQLIDSYYESDERILPVIITGSSTSLTQAFLLALQRTLSQHDLLDVMPETNYRAAVATIQRWRDEYPKTFEQLKKKIDLPIEEYISRLEDYDTKSYELFERVYPLLTSGSLFNPFLGFDVIELYESAARGLRQKGYSGIYLVYDEFSKFLEANITEASVSDTKMLQDFAEKCNRSGTLQMHIMLISHKEIANYIDKLPKQKVDGWRGVSERFLHVHLNNHFSQTYEIIASVIQKDAELWDAFSRKFSGNFRDLAGKYSRHPLFSDVDGQTAQAIVYDSYPLHPVSTFILPRLSEKVAQNERTLFTFLSAEGTSTLSAFLDTYDDQDFRVITPDLIYDYFEPLLKKEAYEGGIHHTFILASLILERLGDDLLQRKIVKTIALIYMLEQFERIRPTIGELADVFSVSYTHEEIEEAIRDLVGSKFLVYLKRSNGYLQLKQASGIDIQEKIHDLIEAKASRIVVKDILNSTNFDSFVYPSRYNDEHWMTRYFSFTFNDGSEVGSDTDWTQKAQMIPGDGVVFAIIPQAEEAIPEIQEKLIASSGSIERCIFIIPKHHSEIEEIVREFYAVSLLRDEVRDDRVLFDEYEVIYEDLYDVICEYIAQYTHPEQRKATYIHKGKVVDIQRKARLTELASEICEKTYTHTPTVNNEMINKDEITSMANNSRSKIIAALLRNELEPNLGLLGTGQEVSIARNTLFNTGVLIEENGHLVVNSRIDDPNMAYLLDAIRRFLSGAGNGVRFSELYDQLIRPEYGIGLRRGIIPIYLAVVLHEYKQQLILADRFGPVSLSSDVVQQIAAEPGDFTVSHVEWSQDKAEFVRKLEAVFSDSVVEAEKNANVYDYVVNAMRRWYMSLPKYTKECRIYPDAQPIDKRRLEWMRLLRQNDSGFELLFKKIPAAFHYHDALEGLDENIQAAKSSFDRMLGRLEAEIAKRTKELLALPSAQANIDQQSLYSVVKDWCESLDPRVFEQVFSDGTEKALALMESVTNDEHTFILRLSKLATGLRIEDWIDNTIERYMEALSRFKTTAEEFQAASENDEQGELPEGAGFQIVYPDATGKPVTKRFASVTPTARSMILKKRVEAALKEMGQAITEQEKRQVLMEVLRDLC